MQTYNNWHQSPMQGAIATPTDWERETLADDLYLAFEMLSKCHDHALKHGFKESRSGLYTALADAYNSAQEALQRLDDATDY